MRIPRPFEALYIGLQRCFLPPNLLAIAVEGGLVDGALGVQSHDPVDLLLYVAQSTPCGIELRGVRVVAAGHHLLVLADLDESCDDGFPELRREHVLADRATALSARAIGAAPPAYEKETPRSLRAVPVNVASASAVCEARAQERRPMLERPLFQSPRDGSVGLQIEEWRVCDREGPPVDRARRLSEVYTDVL